MNKIFIHHCIKCRKEINTLTNKEKLVFVHIHYIGDLCAKCYFKLLEQKKVPKLKMCNNERRLNNE